MLGKNRVKPRRERPLETLTITESFWAYRIPRALCSKFAAVAFADTVEPSVIEDVLACEEQLSDCYLIQADSFCYCL